LTAPTTPAPSSGAALATVPEDVAALAALLEATDGDMPYDGFSQSLGPDKLGIPRRVFNQSKGVDANGVRITVDRFVDPVSQVATETIDAILIMEHTQRAFTQFNQETEESTTVCKSVDCVTGIEQATNKPRACHGCPDAVWRTSPAGKRSVNCSEQFHVLGVDRATREAFTLLFQKTSADTIRKHLQRHHVGKLELKNGKRVNMPLYYRYVRLGLEVSENGKFAVPWIEPVGIANVADMLLSKETIDAYGDLFTHAFEGEAAREAAASSAPAGEVIDAAGTSFNPDEFQR
jgi:hypothetical protein